jgi:hypothetical protein
VPEFAFSLSNQAKLRHFWTDLVFITTLVARYLRQRNIAMTSITRISKTARNFVERDGLSA